MDKLSSITDKFAGRAAILAGAALTAGGVTQIVHSQRQADNQVVGVAGYLALSFFIVALLSVAPSFIALARRARSRVAAWAALAAAAGTTILGLTSITSIVNGHDLGPVQRRRAGHQRSLAGRLDHPRRLAEARRQGTGGRRGRTAHHLGRDDPARDPRRRRPRRRLLPRRSATC